MTTDIDVVNGGGERPTLPVSEYAEDAITETHRGRKATMTGKDSPGHGAETGANDEFQSSVFGVGEGISVDKYSVGSMENVDTSESNVANPTSNGNDNNNDKNSENVEFDREVGVTKGDTSEEKSSTNDNTTWNSGMELEDIGRSHQAFLPGSSMRSLSTKPTSFRNKEQDVFVKKGARARALITTALKALADGLALDTDAVAGKEGRDESIGLSRSTKATDNDNDECHRKTWNARTDFAHVQDLAQEKSKECIALKRKLQESQSHLEVLQKENSASQQSNTQLNAKVDRTLEALQIAGANAANARAESDASNARAESLSGQLNDLQSVIEETKRGMEVVRREHDEVSRAARSVEGRLIQVESELTRAVRSKKDAVEERDFLKARTEKSEKLARSLQDNVDDYHDEIRMLKKDLLEMEELEKVRSDRTQRVESEFQEARAGLLEATSAAAEAESTVTSLRSAIEELRRENESLHEKMNASRDSLAKDRTKQNEALTLAERQAQKWKMKYDEADEEARKVKMDKASAEKQADQMKSRVANMERRLNDSNKQFSRVENTLSVSSAVTPHDSGNIGFINAFGAKDNSVIFEESNKRKYVAELPQRESSKAPHNLSSRQLTYSYQKEKENVSHLNKQDEPKRKESICTGPKRKVVRSNKCCLCSKEGGMILTCQCDNINCEKRAHALCIGKFRSGKTGLTILCDEAK